MLNGEPMLAGVMNRVFDPIQVTVIQVLEVLQERSKSWKLNTVWGYVTVITKRHALVQGVLFRAEGTVRKWPSGMKLSKGVAGCLLPV